MAVQSVFLAGTAKLDTHFGCNCVYLYPYSQIELICSPLLLEKRNWKKLRSLLQSPKAEFVAVYGRRRVRKTFLIRKAYANKFTFQFTGLANVNRKIQLAQFHAALVKFATNLSWDPNPASDWFEAFRQLEKYIELLPGDEKKILFLDELPWMDSQNAGFLPALEHFWNSWASARDDILFVVCGSAASWMINHLLKNRGGLHNRVTDRIKLSPFTLSETEEFLKAKNAVGDRYQILLLYMVFGGIPFYLEKIESGKSAMQNINDLCFSADAPFRLEYENLYASLFKRHERHLSIIEALASKRKGLTRYEIVQNTKLSDGGGLSRLLKELDESNFIRKYKVFGRKEKLYQLIDPFSLFYLRFIKKSDEEDESYWLNLIDTPRFYAWAGSAFEMICLHHIPHIKKALGISGVQTSVYTWQNPKAQIDLVIDRKDRVINICEMKFSVRPFSIDKNYAENLSNKITIFKAVTQSSKAIFLTMITTYGIIDKKHWGLVQNNLEMDILFE